MSQHKPYPAYKDSGVDKLGPVPEHWQVKRLKFIANVQTGVAKGKDNDGKDTIEVPYLRVANVQDGYLSLDDVATIEIPREDLPRYSLRPGDVLMNEGGDFDKLGRGHVWHGEIEPCIHQNHVFAVRPIKVPSYWLNAFTSSQVAQFYFMARSKQSTNLASISSSNVMELPVVIPPDDELPAVLAHLDSETARIDALIEKKTRFIELLREKRQTLITHAVTKGLDPNVKLKDSGVEWLGEVPEHWVVNRLRHNIDGPLSYGANEAAESDEPDDPRFIRITDLNEDGTLREDTFKSLPHVVAQPYLLRDGDVLLARSGATVGKSFIYRESMGPACYAGYLIRARLLPSKLISQYFWLCTQSTYYWDFISGSNIQATIQNVSGEKYSNLWLALPPVIEQQRIVEFLEGACTRFEALRVKTERSIVLLRERRSALITAAVTGQIDLREST